MEHKGGIMFSANTKIISALEYCALKKYIAKFTEIQFSKHSCSRALNAVNYKLHQTQASIYSPTLGL